MAATEKRGKKRNVDGNTHTADGKDAMAVCAGRSRSLKQDIKKMLLDASFSDILFICGNAQEELPAARLLVAARSPVLEAMLLKSQMAECKQLRIPLPEIDAAIMRICLEFFYTNTVQERSWLGPESVMKVISAAKFFLVSKLEHISISYLHSIIDVCCDDKTELIKAYSYGVHLHGAHPCTHLRALLQKLIKCIGLNAGMWDFQCLKHVSEQALLHLAQTFSERDGEVYDAFHVIVRWCAYRVMLLSDDPAKEEDVITSVIEELLPLSDTDLCKHISTVKGLQIIYTSEDTSRIMNLLAEQLAIILRKFPLDFSRIPALILCGVIEPLNIVPGTFLREAYRFQALRKLDFLRWDEFGHGTNYRISEDDLTVISCESHDLLGFARCNFGFNIYSNRTLQWEIIMLTPCESFRVGFYRSNPFLSQKICHTRVLGDQEGSCGLSSDGMLLYNFKEKTGAFNYCDEDWFDEGDKLRVGVCLDTDGCSFYINDVEVLGVWDISWQANEMIYPAISMQKPGRAQVKMVIGDRLTNPRRLNDGEER